MDAIKAPFPWFGGKSRAAPLIWERLGNVPNYVEPFAGSLAVLLGRPHAPGIETINDLDAYIANVWRCLAWRPEETAQHATWPCNEADLHARHLWLRAQRADFTAKLMGTPDYCDPKIAGWWLWGIAQWIGGGWCGEGSAGPWGTDNEGRMVRLSNDGQGITKKRLHLGDAGQGVSKEGTKLLPWFHAIQTRLRRVRVACGDWKRVMGDSVTHKHGLTGIVLDPPYSTEEGRDMNIYAEDSGTVAHEVRSWCLEHGRHPQLRIALCGYDDAHDTLLAQGWTVAAWKAHGGYGNQGQGQGRENASRERIWFSPACLDARQGSLF